LVVCGQVATNGSGKTIDRLVNKMKNTNSKDNATVEECICENVKKTEEPFLGNVNCKMFLTKEFN